ncbi:MAG: PRC-barrel domain-containing protein [Clostridia bacterium]|nr:PRC-barrel domain-containing protein [Clostridia bacterium]
MLNFTSIVGKNVFAVSSGKIVGTMLSAKFNRSLTRLRYYEIFNDDDGETYYFGEKAVTSVLDAVVITSESRLVNSLEEECVDCPINLPVYTTRGKFIGKVSDILLEKTTVVKIVVGDQQFSPSTVKAKSDNLLVIDHETVCQNESKSASEQSPVSANGSVDTSLPTRSFLLGRMVSADIVLRDGNGFLARSGDIVDEKMLARASGSGKLLLLASNIK